MPISLPKSRFAAILAIVILLYAADARAQTWSDINLGGPGNPELWSTSGNWSTNSIPISGTKTALIFNQNATGPHFVADDITNGVVTQFAVNSLMFSSTQTYTVGISGLATGITLGGTNSIVMMTKDAAAVTISAPLTLGANATIADYAVAAQGMTLSGGLNTGNFTANFVSGTINPSNIVSIPGTITVSVAITGSGNVAVNSLLGTVIFSSGTGNSYDGTTTIASGTLQFNAANTIGGSGASMTVNSGGIASFNYAIDQASLNRIATPSAGIAALNVTSSNDLNFSSFANLSLGATANVTYSGATLTPNGTIYRLGGGSGTLTVTTALGGTANSLIVARTGYLTATTVVLNPTSSETYQGSTTINNLSTLQLNFSGLTTPTDLIDPASALTLAGGTLNITALTAVANSQTFSGVTLNSGASAITATLGGATNITLNLNAITRSTPGSTLNFPDVASLGVGGSITTSNSTPNGILGGWATVNGTDFAAVSGGAIAAVTYNNIYTADPTTWTDGDNNSYNPTGAVAFSVATSSTANSLRFATGSSTLTLTGTNIITSGGILIVSGADATIQGGTLAGSSGGDLILQNFGNTLTIASNIANNGTATALTKSGTGSVVLTGTNLTYTGVTYVNQGMLQFGNGSLTATPVSSIIAITGSGLLSP